MKFQIKNEKYMLALLGLLVWACSSNNIDIENMRCEYQISPIGIDSPAPRLLGITQPIMKMQQSFLKTAISYISPPGNKI